MGDILKNYPALSSSFYFWPRFNSGDAITFFPRPVDIANESAEWPIYM